MTPEEASEKIQAIQILAAIHRLRDRFIDVLAEEYANPRVACIAMAVVQAQVLRGDFPGVDAEDIRIIREGIDMQLCDLGKG